MKFIQPKSENENTFTPIFGRMFRRSIQLNLRLHAAVLFTCSALLLPHTAMAGGDVEVDIYELTNTGVGGNIGTITLTENEHGVVFTPQLKKLSPGLHGFHVHQNASCQPKDDDGKVVPGGAAGGHLDTQTTQHHGLPWGDGHDGDLPALFVNDDGNANSPVLAPRLSLKALDKHALMIHQNGDNYADDPLPLGGGGSRFACGVIEVK